MNTTATTNTKTKRNVRTATTKNATAFDKTFGGLITGRQSAFVKWIITNDEFLGYDLKDQKNVLKAILKARSH